MGNALAGRLFHSLLQRNVPVLTQDVCDRSDPRRTAA